MILAGLLHLFAAYLQSLTLLLKNLGAVWLLKDVTDR